MRIIIFGSASSIAEVLTKVMEQKLFTVCAVVPRVNRQTGDLLNSQALVEAAEKLRIKVIPATDVNATSFIAELKSLSPDLLVNWGHGQLFKEDLLNLCGAGVLNLHPGLLPAGRGSGAVVGEIWNGQKEIGQVAHYMDTDLDKGRIVHSRSFSLSGMEYQDEVNAKLSEGSVDFFITAISKALAGEKGRKVQGFGRYYPKFVEGDDIIDWTQTSEFILRRIRSRSPYILSRSFVNPDRKEFFIRKASHADVDPYYTHVGQVIDRSKSKGNLVKTGDTAIWIEEVSFDKSAFKTASFPIGTSFLSNYLQEFVKLHREMASMKAEIESIKSKLNLSEK